MFEHGTKSLYLSVLTKLIASLHSFDFFHIFCFFYFCLVFVETVYASSFFCSLLHLYMLVFSLCAFFCRCNSFYMYFARLFVASCKHVQCPVGQHCLEDQNLMPHCVTCSITCPPYDPAVKSVISNPARLVCGVDGLTYRNLCEIKRTACMLGRSIPVAYRGACKGKIIFNQYYYH